MSSRTRFIVSAPEAQVITNLDSIFALKDWAPSQSNSDQGLYRQFKLTTLSTPPITTIEFENYDENGVLERSLLMQLSIKLGHEVVRVSVDRHGTSIESRAGDSLILDWDGGGLWHFLVESGARPPALKHEYIQNAELKSEAIDPGEFIASLLSDYFPSVPSNELIPQVRQRYFKKPSSQKPKLPSKTFSGI